VNRLSVVRKVAGPGRCVSLRVSVLHASSAVFAQ